MFSRVPTIFWIRVISAGCNFGEVSSMTIWVFLPYIIGTCWYGESTGSSGGGCWNFVKAFVMYPGIDNSTVSINGVHDPIINACFISDENIFVNLFHKMTATNWHFKYSYKERTILGEAVATQLNCSQLNFPINNFYDFERESVYCFYRHGESITVNLDDLTKVRTQTIVTESLGQMYFIYNEIVVANSSDTVLFFKRVGTRNIDN